MQLSSSTIADEQDNSGTKSSRSWCSRPKLLIGFILLGLVIYVIVDSTTTRHIQYVVDMALDWIQENPMLGFFLFTIGYILATICFVPGSILTLGAGFVFAKAYTSLGVGVVVGTVAVFMGASIGAIVSFLLARYLLRDAATLLSQRYSTLAAMDEALRHNGVKIFILLHLSPIIPFNAINYVGGISSVSLRDYCIALVAILPGTILYVFLGASAGTLADGKMVKSTNPTITITLIVVGIVFGVLAIWLTTRYARKELKTVLEKRRRQQQQHQQQQDLAAGNDSSIVAARENSNNEPGRILEVVGNIEAPY